MKKFDDEIVESSIRTLLVGMGIDWVQDPNFKETPKRVAKAYKELNRGLYEEEPKIKIFPTTYKGMVFFKSIKAIGLCPHHLLPIEMDISFAYLPKKNALGLSKVSRIVKYLCSRPVLQEDLTRDIVGHFTKLLKPLGVAVVIRGIHGCMKFRGIKEATVVKTSEMTGSFLTQSETREEFFNLIKENAVFTIE